ncbi:MAG: hypothetical protein ACI9FN_002104, partial [Saprospiraceae bacterium]
MFKSFACFLILFGSCFSVSATNYYWIGDGGNWSDLSHWATTSGGFVTHVQVPTSEDNVIFDANSFSIDGEVVEFNNDIVFVRDFDMLHVDQRVIVNGGKGVILSSFGSLGLTPIVDWNFKGVINFTGDKMDNTIDFGGNIGALEMYIVGGGQWHLTSNLEVDSIFQITEGGFNTNDFNLRTQYFYILSDSPKDVAFTSSTIEIWGRYGDREFYDSNFDTISAKINLTNLTLDAGNSRINITASSTELWFTGEGDISLYDVHFTSAVGRNYIRPFNSDASVSWNTLQLLGHTRMEGSHTIDNCLLNSNKIYRLEDGQTFSINKILAVGACNGGITITSLRAGLPVDIVSNSDINLEYVTLRDIRASGGGNFIATNSTDLGNNTNWSFTNSEAVDFFWIGGSGNWLDPNHWSLSSGGTSSGCVPFGKDNAFFDANSFTDAEEKVILNLEDVFIHDLIWEGVSGSPVLDGNEENSMHIKGSLRFDAAMTHLFGGDYYFESSEAGNTIEMNGHPFRRELHFSGDAADWTSLDDIYVEGKVDHHSGTIITNGNMWDIWKYESFGDRPRHLDMRGSHIDLHDVLNQYNYPVFRPEWRIHTNNYSSDTEGSTIEFHTIYYAAFIHEGDEVGLEYNNVIFSSYGGELSSYNWSGNPLSMTIIDSCIFRARGQFFGNQELNYMEFTPGYDYVFGSVENIQINVLNANGTCDEGHISIVSRDAGRASNFQIANDHVFENLIVKDIHNTGGSLTANNSIDQGNNQGWDIDVLQSRKLYWVNNTGEWEDSNHWSLTSGGTGGECIPTPIDDVVFDELSFTEINQSVYSDNNRFLQCHNMTWRNVFGFPNLGYFYDDINKVGKGTDNIKIHGSLEYDTDMYLNIYWHNFATNESDSIRTNGIVLPGIKMLGYGEITFLDELTSWSFEHNNGAVIMKNITWTNNHYYTYNYNAEFMSSLFENVEIHLGREGNTQSVFSDYAVNHNIQFLNSTIFLDGPLSYLISEHSLAFDKVISTDPNGQVIFGDRFPTNRKPDEINEYSFNYIELASDATFLGQFRTDTLIGSPGKVYTLEAMETAYVNEYLQLIGNNCTPILLRSDASGTLANFSMPPSSTNVVNFIEMRDNNAIGGADFIAGSRSTNISQSNRGWLFEDPPQYIETGFLGVDRALCLNSNLDLSAFNYSPGESYVWNDGSTDTILNVNQTGEYSARVTFDNGCSIEDRIRILEPEDFEVKLGADTIICDGTILTIDASIGFQGVNYFWSDSTKGAFIDIANQGEYRIYAEVDGCISSDTISITSQTIPVVDLGGDRSVCEGDSITLSPSVNEFNVIWSDASIEKELVVRSEGSYAIEVEINNCTNTDSVFIDFVALPELNLGPDTLLCEGQIIALNIISEDNVEYVWQDAQIMLPRSIAEESLYILIGSRTGCATSDSIFVSFQEALELELGENRVACEGDTINLNSNIIADVYIWNNGTTSDNIAVTNSQTITLSVEKGVCETTDSVIVEFNTYPLVEIGPQDTMVCSNNLYTLNAGVNGTWQDQSVSQELSITGAGTYRVEVDNKGCLTSDAIIVTIQDAPVLDIGEDQQACEDDIIRLSTGVSADTYLWSTGETAESIAIQSEGLYSVIVVDDVCEVLDSINVMFNMYPSLEFASSDTAICQKEELLLSVEQEGLWQDGSISRQYSINQEGLYHVVLDNNGCETRDSIQVTILPLPQIDLGMDTTICSGDQFEIQAPSDIDDFIWEDGSIDDVRSITEEGRYWLEVYKNGCNNADSLNVTVRQLPKFELGRDTTVCNDEVFTLDPIEAEGNLLWPNGSSGMTFQVSEPDLIVASADNGCLSIDSIQVDFRQCIYFTAYLPNIFSPDQNGMNDTFRPQFNDGIEIISYNFKVYDRWGGEVFASSTILEGW